MFAASQKLIKQLDRIAGIALYRRIDRFPHCSRTPAANHGLDRFLVDLTFFVSVEREFLKLLIHPTELAVGDLDQILGSTDWQLKLVSLVGAGDQPLGRSFFISLLAASTFCGRVTLDLRSRFVDRFDVVDLPFFVDVADAADAYANGAGGATGL